MLRDAAAFRGGRIRPWRRKLSGADAAGREVELPVGRFLARIGVGNLRVAGAVTGGFGTLRGPGVSGAKIAPRGARDATMGSGRPADWPVVGDLPQGGYGPSPGCPSPSPGWGGGRNGRKPGRSYGSGASAPGASGVSRPDTCVGSRLRSWRPTNFGGWTSGTGRGCAATHPRFVLGHGRFEVDSRAGAGLSRGAASAPNNRARAPQWSRRAPGNPRRCRP